MAVLADDTVQTILSAAKLLTARTRAAAEPDTLRFSCDTKAKIKIGASSRGGESRPSR